MAALPIELVDALPQVGDLGLDEEDRADFAAIAKLGQAGRQALGAGQCFRGFGKPPLPSFVPGLESVHVRPFPRSRY